MHGDRPSCFLCCGPLVGSWGHKSDKTRCSVLCACGPPEGGALTEAFLSDLLRFSKCRGGGHGVP